jgi:hypothetical protein
MDSNRFDDLTRTLATTTSRRGFLKTLAGGAAGALLAAFGVGEAAAKDCKKAGQLCKNTKECCSGICYNGTCVSACPSGSKPCNGTCIPNSQCCNGACPTGQTCRGGQCVNCAPDEAHVDSCDSSLCCSGIMLTSPGCSSGGTCCPESGCIF